jgi:hypothetical protein
VASGPDRTEAAKKIIILLAHTDNRFASNGAGHGNKITIQ